ncbi:MAG TPA: response regulator [Rheinheimera sp.]|nr:response regulator [Rheinheimera sp.]
MLKVLFIDDDAYILSAYQRMLHSSPYQCSYLQQPTDLWQLLEFQPFDIVLADQQMPGITGTELLWQLQQRYPAIKRVLISGDLSFALKQQSPELTLNATLSKPCSKAALLECLQSHGRSEQYQHDK